MQRKFLGYQISPTGILFIATKSVERFKDKVRVITRRNRGRSFQQIITELNLLIPGWTRYFKLAKAESTLGELDSWIRRKLRCYKLKQFKRAVTIANNLTAMGIRKRSAWKVAKSGKGWWRLAHVAQVDRAMGWGWFKMQGLIGLKEIYQSL